jgi:class 3 adenylate cyclase/tetratricopeptide (TPR) repeat protein
VQNNPDLAATVAASIAALEAQRPLLGDAVVDAAISALRRQFAEQESPALVAPGTEAERRIVTVMFADVAGFTALSERLDAEHVRRLINGCFSVLVPIIERYGGTLDKFVGDEVMALFGAPVAHENDPERALRAALEMQRAMSDFNAREGTTLGLHFGINTGPVIAGAVGTVERQQYSVMGDAVNLAARLEDASDTGEILVGPQTQRATAATFDFDPPRLLSLRGKSQPVPAYRLVGLKAAPGDSRGVAGLRSPLVGRGRELSALQEVFRDLSRGRGHVVAICADAGLGKSRLVTEARQVLAQEVLWAEGRGLSYTQGTNYSVARDVLYALLGVRGEDTLAHIAGALSDFLETRSAELAADVHPFLARLLDLPTPPQFAEALRRVSGELLHARMLQAYALLVQAIAEDRPLVLSFEDLHWADPSSLGLIKSLLPLTIRRRVVVLLAYRPDERGLHLQSDVLDSFEGRRLQLNLQPLTAGESQLLIEQLLSMVQLPEPTRRLILDRAEGNPFFIEEMLRSLVESDVVRLEAGRAIAVGEVSALALPTTLQGVLMARIDRLSAASRSALQTASVIGRLFQERLLAHVRALEERRARAVDAALGELQQREFIRARSDQQQAFSGLEWVFKHAVTHEVTYDSLLMERRRHLHGVVGDAMEALFSDRLDEVAAALGHHYARAGRSAQAVRFLAKAGYRAQATFANAEAADFFRAVLDELDRLPPGETLDVRRADIAERLGDVLELRGDHAAAREAYLRALGEPDDGDRVSAARRRRKRGAAFVVPRLFDEGLVEYRLAQTHLETIDRAAADAHWWREWLDLQLARLWLHYWRGETATMSAIADAERDAFQRFGSGRQRAHFLMQLSLRNLRRDRYLASDETVALVGRLKDTLPEVEELVEVPHFAFVIGFAQMWRGDLAAAAQQLSEALAMGEQVGDIIMQLRCVTYQALTQRKRGDVDACEEYARRALKDATQMNMTEYVAAAQANLGWVAWRRGDLAAAETRAREALALWHTMPVRYTFDWMAACPLMAVSSRQGAFDDAIANARLVLNPSQQPLPAMIADAGREAVVAWEAGLPQDAARLIVRFVEVGAEWGYT